MYKVKTEWYFAQSKSHLALTKQANSERELWTMILDGKLDDLLPSLSPEVRGPLEVFRKELFQHLERVAETAQRAVDEYKQANPNCTKKDYVNFAKSKYDPTVFSLHSKIFDGKASMKSIVDLIKQNCGVKSFEPARTAFELQHLNYYKSDMY